MSARFVFLLICASTFAAPASSEEIKSTVDGTLTVHFAPPPAARQPTRPETCRRAWNKRLSEYEALPSSARTPATVTRLDYRNCMYDCLKEPGAAAGVCKLGQLLAP